MLKITTDQVTFDDRSTFTVEASNLGLKPGVWPETIELEDKQGRKTTFGPLYMPHYEMYSSDHELLSVRYFGPHMLILEVLND